jgi:hypothetical protein
MISFVLNGSLAQDQVVSTETRQKIVVVVFTYLRILEPQQLRPDPESPIWKVLSKYVSLEWQHIFTKTKKDFWPELNASEPITNQTTV